MAEARRQTRSESGETPNTSASPSAVSGDVPAPANVISINWHAAFQSPEFQAELQSAMNNFHISTPPVTIQSLPPSTPERCVPTPRLIVQGGAFSAGRLGLKADFFDGIKEAAKKGYRVLQQNGTAVDAAEAAVCALEDNVYFNAGHGAFYTILAPENVELDGNNRLVRCDAMIMNGHTLDTGAVMNVHDFSHPVSLARKVMDDPLHCALCGEGAKNFAKSIDFPTLEDPKELIVEGRSLGVEEKRLETFINYHYKREAIEEDRRFNTATAVAIDTNGHMACATSTGGIPGALKGRIGDAPLVGCGGYANEFGAATSTGIGEQIMKVTLAREVVHNMERGQNAQEAAKNALTRMETRVKDGLGGVIAIDRKGNFGKAFNTDVMIWATAKDNTLQFGMEQNEVKTEQLMNDN